MRCNGVLLVAFLAAGCGRTVDNQDCQRVGSVLRDAWLAEAKKAAPRDPVGAERASGVIQAETDRLVLDWSTECKRELEGRQVDKHELDCLLASKSVADINLCAQR